MKIGEKLVVRVFKDLNRRKKIKNLEIIYIPDKVSVQFANAQACAGQLKLQKSRLNIDDRMLSSQVTTDVELYSNFEHQHVFCSDSAQS